MKSLKEVTGQIISVCDLVSSTVRKFILSICCKMYMYEFHFTEIGNLFVSILNTYLGRTVNYISCVFIGYKNVFGPIAELVTNHFRLEQKNYLPLKLQFMSGFGVGLCQVGFPHLRHSINYCPLTSSLAH
jgi:hypothetical protein